MSFSGKSPFYHLYNNFIIITIVQKVWIVLKSEFLCRRNAFKAMIHVTNNLFSKKSTLCRTPAVAPQFHLDDTDSTIGSVAGERDLSSRLWFLSP